MKLIGTMVLEQNMITNAVNNILGLNPMVIFCKTSGEYEEALRYPIAYVISLNSVSMRNAMVKNGIPFVDLPIVQNQHDFQ